MAEPSNIKNLNPDIERFWDTFTADQYKTVGGYKSIFKPTVGGSSTAWQNRECIFSIELHYSDGSTEIRDISAGIIII